MNTLIVVLSTIGIALAVPYLLCGLAAMIVTTHCKTPTEALVRTLYYLARWTSALAQGANAFVIGYRAWVRMNPVRPTCEKCRVPVRRIRRRRAVRVQAQIACKRSAWGRVVRVVFGG
jgi:hypothetical protein